MSELGLYGELPFTLGGEESVVEAEHRALLKAYEPAYDASEGTENYAECFAYATVLANVWAVNERIGNQMIPARMLDNLTIWEEVLKLRPSSKDYDNERRNRVAARLRGIASNATVDIAEAARSIFGDEFEDLVFVAPADAITYWPGLNPGPPGFEWSSNKCIVGVRVIVGAEFQSRRAALADLLQAMLPAWMSFVIGVGAGFICDVGICDVTFV